MSHFNLRGVVILLRHGSRTPLHQINSPAFPSPNWRDPHLIDEIEESKIEFFSAPVQLNSKSQLYGPENFGILTKTGQYECIEFGKKMWIEYGVNHSLLPKCYTPSKVRVISTSLRRNVHSAKCVLAGLYGTRHFSENRKPAEIEVNHHANEILYPNYERFHLLQYNYVNSRKARINIPGCNEIRRLASEELQVDQLMDVFSMESGELPVYFIRDDFMSRQRENFKVPQFFLDHFLEMERLSLLEMKYEYLGADPKVWAESLRYAVGPALDRVVRDIDDIRCNPNAAPFHLFLTHDALLMLLAMVFNIQPNIWPPFAVDFRIEVYTKSRDERQDCYVRFIYKGEPMFRETSELSTDAQPVHNNHKGPEIHDGLFYYRWKDVLEDIKAYCYEDVK